MRTATTLALLLLPVLVACGDGTDPTADDPAEPARSEPTADATETATTSIGGSSEPGRFPDVVGVEAVYDPDADTWTFAVTMTSPYDTPERYADGWRVVGPGGAEYGIHTLAHDHAAEQPFTRRQTGVAIPPDVDRVTIEGRDRANGFGGQTVTVTLQR